METTFDQSNNDHLISQMDQILIEAKYKVLSEENASAAFSPESVPSGLSYLIQNWSHQ